MKSTPSVSTLHVIGVPPSSSSTSSTSAASCFTTWHLSPLRLSITFAVMYLILQLTFFVAVLHRHAVSSSDSSPSTPPYSTTTASDLTISNTNQKNAALSSQSVGQSAAAIASGMNGAGGPAHHALPHMSLLSHNDVNDNTVNDNEINNSNHHLNNNTNSNGLDITGRQTTIGPDASSPSSSPSSTPIDHQNRDHEEQQKQEQLQQFQQSRHAINRDAALLRLQKLKQPPVPQQQQPHVPTITNNNHNKQMMTDEMMWKKKKDETVLEQMNNPIIGLLPRSSTSFASSDPNSTCHFFNDDEFLSHRFSLHMPTFEMWFYQNRGISMYGRDYAQQQADNDRKQQGMLMRKDGEDEKGGDNNSNKIDIVYTYVNGSDPRWLSEMDKYYHHDSENKVTGASSNSIFNKYREWNEFRYSLRSVWKYGRRLFRNIIVVVASPSQIPHWLNTSHPQIKIVYHEQLFARAARELPTFNSLSIESYLHHLPELSDNFLYFNNDLLLGNYVTTSDFIDTEKKIYFQYADYPIRYNLACEMLMRNSVAYPFTLRSIMHTDCVNDPLFANTLLSKYYFDVLPSHWYMHIPHLWNKRILAIMEQRMERLFSESRMNRFRCSKNDIMFHLQYESLRANLSASSLSNSEITELAKLHPNDCLDCQLQRVVVSEMSSAAHHELYVYVVFMNHDHDRFYDNLREKMDTFHPKFIGIDDDLKEPSVETMAFHRNSLHDFFQQYWPTKAPWELD